MTSSSTVTSIYITDSKLVASYNRGPITQLLTLPASCTQTLTYVGELYFGHYGSVFDQNCVASGTRNAPQLAASDAWGQYYYSPAICPTGWTIAATYLSCFTVWPMPYCISLGPGTTAGLCCPSGYSSLMDGHVCASMITEGQAVTFLSPTSYGLSWDTGTPITNKATVATRVRGDGIPVWWQNSDAQVLARASALISTPVATSGASLTKVTALPSSTPTSPGASQTARYPSGGLSASEKAGLGVGIPVAIIAGLVMSCFLWKRRRSQRMIGATGAGKVIPFGPSYEIDSHSRHELPVMAHP